ncbi:hypothetical protein ACHAXA_006576 [Cyclostephanos tholiformis]|uniref:Uncharacterized protein n=1 Tax=Cyclostephanos tholiformis TaxID=382380 RepID=A0ABD3RS42_9STRA
MTTEAFDPFAYDEEDDVDHTPRRRHREEDPSDDAGVLPPEDDPHHRGRGGDGNNAPGGRIDDVAGLGFDASALLSSTFSNHDHDDVVAMVDEFGFPSGAGALDASFGEGCADDDVDDDDEDEDRTTKNEMSSSLCDAGLGTFEGATYVIAEEMSVVHSSRTGKCSVKVRGKLSWEGPIDAAYPDPKRGVYCDVSLRDPGGHLFDAFPSRGKKCARLTTSMIANGLAENFATFRVYASDLINDGGGGKVDDDRYHGGGTLIEYACGDKLRPVPLLMNVSAEALSDRRRLTFQLRVNPSNAHSLLNAAILVHVPAECDGANSLVNSVGRSIGKGEIDTHWADMARILSWRLGELYGGAICEFEALFPYNNIGSSNDDSPPPSDGTDGIASSVVDFPVLLRYDCEGCLLSDVDPDLDFGDI